MIKGVFVEKTSSWDKAGFAVGGLFIAFSVAFAVTGLKNQFQAAIFGIAGGIVCFVCFMSMMLNRNAFVWVEENCITARYAWGARFRCRIGDVEFVAWQTNTLTIQLKSGKRHVIAGLRNPDVLCDAIRRKMTETQTETPDALRRRLERHIKTRQKGITWCCVGIALAFAVIFLLAFLTDGKDLHEFDARERCLGWIMLGIEFGIWIGVFWGASLAGKALLPIEQIKYRLRVAVLKSAPLPPGMVLGLYTDTDWYERLTVYGYPNDFSVYYTLEGLDAQFTLHLIDTSAVFENIEQLPAELDLLLDITETLVDNNSDMMDE